MKKLYLLEEINQNDIDNIKEQDADFITLDYSSHQQLEQNKIPHKVIDEYLDDNERKNIFKQSSRYLIELEQYKNEKTTFHEINLVSIIDRNELLEFLMEKIPKIIAITNILKESKHDIILLSSNLYEIFSQFNHGFRFKIFNTIVDKNITFEKINIPIKMGMIKSNISISRKKYQIIKKTAEKILGNSFNLTRDDLDAKKIILVEFDPEVYFELLKEINNQGIQPILVNFRKSAVYSKKTLSNLRKTNSMIITAEQFLDKSEIDNIKRERMLILNYLKQDNMYENLIPELCLNNNTNVTFFIKRKVTQILIQRIDEYLRCILIAKKMNATKNNLGVLMLNRSGETEKIFANIFGNKLIFLLQHAFSNYIENISYIDLLDEYHDPKNKFIVWGKSVREYLVNIKKIPEDQVIVTGSPKYDSFKPRLKKEMKHKKILITLRPIIFHIEGVRTDLYKIYEKALISIIIACKNLPGTEIIFKLHPQQNIHNEFFRNIIKINFPEAKILQSNSIKELFHDCDLHVNIASDNFDVSTVILEAMILEKPTLNIQLQTKKFDFDVIKKNAIRSIMYNEDIQKEINDLLYNKEKISQILSNSQQCVKDYLSNHGHASKSVIKEILNK
tara:strand:+ start:1397 stop:3253 length:1857 start_codon:yes stop_codon:yes gene_type:complete